MKEGKTSKIGGFTANSLVLPLTFIIAILHVVIISLVFEANHSNTELSEMMQNCNTYQQYATNLQAGTSILSETASAFAQMPVGKDGAVNTGPLVRYAQELGKDRRGPQIAEWFRARNTGPEIQAYIDAAATKSEQMLEVQAHVIALLRSVYPLPPIPDLEAIPSVPLTEEELSMAAEERTEYARSLILDRDYSLLKASVTDNIENCHRTLQEEFGKASSACERYIASLRVWLWIVIFAIIFIMLCTFFLFFHWLILPLRSYAGQITSDKTLNQTSFIREMRQVVSAYNALLKRHNKLEAILRSAAETDALTDLPNRYSLEQYLLEIGESGGAIAVLLFDVNYLKRMNDTNGHLAGDQLLRTAGACIRECFELEGKGRCYRIGGDEFAAVLRDLSEEEVKSRIERFSLALEREKISVSVGYAYADKVDENSFGKLMKKADKFMYAQKKRIHDTDHAALDRETNC
ncbi:MAG: GGDEF domain-containing protein [Clostridia bacterium]|nr:GGDEF domain-containing protein [Clostridia bacterium]